jgi:hypothetical protein
MNMNKKEGRGRRWHVIDKIRELKEPFSGTSSSAAISPEPLTWWDVIEHPERHKKGGNYENS